jgi:ribosomal protein L7/L12
MVEGAESGSKVVKKDIKKEEAEELKASLEAVGATIDIS